MRLYDSGAEWISYRVQVEKRMVSNVRRLFDDLKIHFLALLYSGYGNITIRDGPLANSPVLARILRGALR
jgi:hypothetical protein